MSERGKKHQWSLKSCSGEAIPICDACGMVGEYETAQGRSSIGWVGKPTYGCGHLLTPESDNG